MLSVAGIKNVCCSFYIFFRVYKFGWYRTDVWEKGPWLLLLREYTVHELNINTDLCNLNLIVLAFLSRHSQKLIFYPSYSWHVPAEFIASQILYRFWLQLRLKTPKNIYLYLMPHIFPSKLLFFARSLVKVSRKVVIKV